MITLIQGIIKEINNIKKLKEIYNHTIDILSIASLSCSHCHHKGGLIKHGYYTRYIKHSSGKIGLHILRVKCKQCGKTHALLPEWIVPYSQVSLHDHKKMIDCYLTTKDYQPIMNDNPFIDETTIQYITKQFTHHWLERLKTYQLKIDDHLTRWCFHYFNQQFLQIKRTVNGMEDITHIT